MYISAVGWNIFVYKEKVGWISLDGACIGWIWTKSPAVSRCCGETAKTSTDWCHSLSETLMDQLKSKKWDPLWLSASKRCWKFTAVLPVSPCSTLNNEICSLSQRPKDKNHQSRAKYPNEDIKQSRSLRILFSLPSESLSHTLRLCCCLRRSSSTPSITKSNTFCKGNAEILWV